MSFIVILSLVAAIWGIAALRNNTRHLPASLRYSPVFLTAMGTIIAWQHLSASAPVVTNVKTEVIEVHPYEIVVDLHGSKIRDCHKEDFSAHLIDMKGKSKEVDMIHVGNKFFTEQHAVGDFDTKTIVILAQPIEDYAKLYFTSTHTCALGVSVVSTFGEIDLPAEFNEKKIALAASEAPSSPR